MNSMIYPTKEYRRRMHAHFRVLLHITITQKRDVVVRRVRFALSVKSSGVKYVSGVLFFTRSVSLEGNKRIEKWKEIRQGGKRKHSRRFERGWSFHNSSESSSLPLRCLPLRRCLHSPFPQFCTKLLLLWSRGWSRNTLAVTLAVQGRISYRTLLIIARHCHCHAGDCTRTLFYSVLINSFFRYFNI